MDGVLFFAYFSFASPLFPWLLSLKVKKTHTEIKLIQWLLGVGFLFDLISYFLARSHINTYLVTNLFFLFQVVVLLAIYAVKLPKYKVYLMVGAALVLIFFLIDFLFFQGMRALNSFSVSLSGLMMIILSLFYFGVLIRDLPETFVHRMPMVWINIAVLVYYSGNLFLFIFNNYFTLDSEGNQRVMWILHNILNISKNAIFMVAIWQNLRKNN